MLKVGFGCVFQTLHATVLLDLVPALQTTAPTTSALRTELQDQSRVSRQRYRVLPSAFEQPSALGEFRAKPHKRKTPTFDLEQTLGITSQPGLTGCLICLLNLVWTNSQAACGSLQWFCSKEKVKIKGFIKVKCKFFNVWGIYSCV